ncbi:MAG: hypothetical protein ACI924_002147 [Flavobacterium sp.]|jgi:hypothetical protein
MKIKIFSGEVLKKNCSNEPLWEENVPEGVPELIKKDNLFGFLDHFEVRKLHILTSKFA